MADDGGRRCVWRPDQPCPWTPVGRDAEIVRLVALGWTDPQIGRALHLNSYTISHAIGRMCDFLGFARGPLGSSSRRARLAAWAGRHGYAPDDRQGTVNTG